MTDPDLARLCFIHSEQNVTSDGKLMSVQLYKMKITRLFLKKENFDGLLLYTVLENSYSLFLLIVKGQPLLPFLTLVLLLLRY